MQLSAKDVKDFLRAYPRMALQPSRDNTTVFEGSLDFSAAAAGKPAVAESYRLRVVVAPQPDALPKVYEIGGRIPLEADDHVNPGGNLCLGSPLSLRIALGRETTLLRFVDRCVVPFLYASSIRAPGEGLVFGELPHGAAGLLQDYEEIFGVKGATAIKQAIRLLATKRRIANKMPCPCDCGLRLGRCVLHIRLNALRAVASRSSFARLL